MEELQVKGKVVAAAAAAAAVVVVVVVLPVVVIAFLVGLRHGDPARGVSRIMCLPGPSVLSQHVELE